MLSKCLKNLCFFLPGDVSSLLWVDKYKPKSVKEIVGQNGDKSNAKKLRKWLQEWKENHTPKPSGAGALKPKKSIIII